MSEDGDFMPTGVIGAAAGLLKAAIRSLNVELTGLLATEGFGLGVAAGSGEDTLVAVGTGGGDTGFSIGAGACAGAGAGGSWICLFSGSGSVSCLGWFSCVCSGGSTTEVSGPGGAGVGVSTRSTIDCRVCTCSGSRLGLGGRAGRGGAGGSYFSTKFLGKMPSFLDPVSSV